MAMEACCGAHHLGRPLHCIGHQVRLMSPEYVQPYVKAQKNDERDAEAIAEAATRPTMRFVELKSEMQLDTQSLHRARSRLVGARTALINQLRAVLLERGVTVAQGRRKLERYLALVLDSEDAPPLRLSARMRLLIDDMRGQWRELDRRIAAFDAEFVTAARSDETTKRLATMPGIGAMNATALVAAVGNARTFARARDLAAGSGLSHDKLPPEAGPGCSASPSAGTNTCARLLVHGARAALPSLAATKGSLGNRLRGLSARAHRNT
jgi:transposase